VTRPPANRTAVEHFATLAPKERSVAIHRYVALLASPALGSFQPHLQRRLERLRQELEDDARDLAAAKRRVTP
jgi:hypothetical protein